MQDVNLMSEIYTKEELEAEAKRRKLLNEKPSTLICVLIGGISGSVTTVFLLLALKPFADVLGEMVK